MAQFQISIYNLYQSGGYTYFRVNFDWEWSSCPFIASNTDILGFGWTENMYLQTGLSTSYQYVTYKDNYTGYTREVNSSIVSVNSTTNAKSTFTTMTVLSSQPLQYEWACNGYGSILLRKAGTVPECEMMIKYGKSTSGVSPSVSIPWGVSFSFTSGVATMDECPVYEP